MRALLTFGLLLLGGCTHTSPKTDISGIWINQTILDAAALSQSLNTQGSNLEWNIDIHAGKAQVSSGFEMAEGNLLQTSLTPGPSTMAAIAVTHCASTANSSSNWAKSI